MKALQRGKTYGGCPPAHTKRSPIQSVRNVRFVNSLLVSSSLLSTWSVTELRFRSLNMRCRHNVVCKCPTSIFQHSLRPSAHATISPRTHGTKSSTEKACLQNARCMYCANAVGIIKCAGDLLQFRKFEVQFSSKN